MLGPLDTNLVKKRQSCELLGFFGMFVQFMLGFISIGSLVAKKFLPSEKRSWKIFCLDIWKQLGTSLLAHFLNVFLSVYLEESTNSGNGCVWYFMNFLLDSIFGLVLAYIFFKIVDHYALKYNIEVLKSGVYMDESVNLVNEDGEVENTDRYINYRIWGLQMLVWVMIVFLSKIIVFFFEIKYSKPIFNFGVEVLAPFHGHPHIELVTVMIVIPVTCNTI